MSYLLGTSFFFKPNNGLEMNRLWHYNIRHADIQPARVVAIYEGDSPRYNRPGVEEISLPGDLGHIGAHLNGTKPYHLTGWSSSVCALAMLAYTAGLDFCYRESDCLAFGSYMKRMYDDMGDGQFVFGKKMESAPWMTCAQSLFLMRHSFIPAFVSVYLSLPPDRKMLGEDKFCHVAACYPALSRRLSFGVDRERPIPWDSDAFYAQQFTQEELAEATKRNLI